jgi:hypothetical protein
MAEQFTHLTRLNLSIIPLWHIILVPNGLELRLNDGRVCRSASEGLLQIQANHFKVGGNTH